MKIYTTALLMSYIFIDFFLILHPGTHVIMFTFPMQAFLAKLAYSPGPVSLSQPTLWADNAISPLSVTTRQKHHISSSISELKDTRQTLIVSDSNNHYIILTCFKHLQSTSKTNNWNVSFTLWSHMCIHRFVKRLVWKCISCYYQNRQCLIINWNTIQKFMHLYWSNWEA